MMEADRRRLLMKEFYEAICLPLTDTKGKDYTQKSEDANSNFKRIAERMKAKGFDKYDILNVYFNKHLDAIESWMIHRKLESSEDIFGCISDAVNYLLIFAMLLIEDGHNPFPIPHPLGPHQFSGGDLNTLTVGDLKHALSPAKTDSPDSSDREQVKS